MLRSGHDWGSLLCRGRAKSPGAQKPHGCRINAIRLAFCIGHRVQKRIYKCLTIIPIRPSSPPCRSNLSNRSNSLATHSFCRQSEKGKNSDRKSSQLSARGSTYSELSKIRCPRGKPFAKWSPTGSPYFPLSVVERPEFSGLVQWWCIRHARPTPQNSSVPVIRARRIHH